jgi:hypothetical protein
MSNHPNSPDSEQEIGELITEIKSRINARLGELMTALIKNADEALLEGAEAAHFSHEKDVYFMLKQKLANVKTELAVDFLSKVTPLLRPYSIVQAEEAAQKVEELDDELSLIGQDDMEDIVLVKNIGAATASKFREQISNLETRLEHLALKTPDIFTKDAISPMKLSQAFDDALIGKFETAERKIMFKLFDEEIASKLDSLYDRINDALIEAGILPQIKLGGGRDPARRTAAPPPPPVEETPGEEPAPYAGGDMGGYAPGGAPAGTQGGAAPAAPAPEGTDVGGYAQTAAPGTYHAANNGSAAPAGGEAPAGTPTTGGGFSGKQPPPDANGQYVHQTAGMPAGKVSQAISNFMGTPLQGGGAETAQSGGESAVYPASTAQHFGHDEILQALSDLQAQPQFEQPSELKFDAEAVKQAVLQSIARSSGGVVTKGINQIAEKTIDFIELVFDAIIEDEDISDTIKALLLRLQIPVIKASMLDQEFFIYDDHPARVLLDKISEVGVGVTVHTDEIYIKLEKIVSQLVSEYELDTTTFQKALDKLNAYVEARENEARAKEEEAQQQALREHARNTVLKSLRGVTAGKTLPEPIHALVLKRWPTLMFNHYLKAGKENDEWVAILECLRDIIDSVQPLQSAEDLAHLVAEKDNLVERAQGLLAKTYKSKKDIKFVISGLIETYDDMIEDAAFTEDEVQTAEATVAEEGPREKEPIKVEPAHVPKKPLPSNIMPGMWFQIYMGADLSPRRCKLSVIIVEDEKLIFVTHEGELISEKSFEEFIDELDSGKSSVIMGHSVFDYALNSVITKLDPTKH